MSDQKSICIAGAGAVGLYLAARFAAKSKVALLVRDTQSLKGDALVLSGAEELSVPRSQLNVVEMQQARELPQGTVFWIAVKAYDLLPLLKELQQYLYEDSIVVLLSNGLGLLAEARSVLSGRTPLIRVAPEFGVQKRAALQVLVAGRDPHVQLAYPAEFAKQGALVKELLVSAGINSRAAQSVEACEWRKAAINIVVNGIATILDAENGCILASQALRSLAAELLREVAEVAACEGINIDLSSTELLSGLERHKKNINSTLADLRLGRRSEAGYFVGRCLECALRHGVSAPSLRSIAALLEYKVGFR